MSSIAQARRAIQRAREIVERPKTPGGRVAAERRLRAKKLRLSAALREAQEARRG